MEEQVLIPLMNVRSMIWYSLQLVLIFFWLALSADSLLEMIRFFVTFILNADELNDLWIIAKFTLANHTRSALQPFNYMHLVVASLWLVINLVLSMYRAAACTGITSFIYISVKNVLRGKFQFSQGKRPPFRRQNTNLLTTITTSWIPYV